MKPASPSHNLLNYFQLSCLHCFYHSAKFNSEQKALVEWLTGQLASTEITSDWCHTDTLQVPPTEERSSIHSFLVTKMPNFQSFKKFFSSKKSAWSRNNNSVILPGLSKLTQTCTFEVFHICLAFGTLTPRLWRLKVPEKLFSGWCTAFQFADK